VALPERHKDLVVGVRQGSLAWKEAAALRSMAVGLEAVALVVAPGMPAVELVY
jgi:hypothetical protein